jgi:hypothetical protein
MKRDSRSVEELLESSNHLYYEFWMFMNLSNTLSTGIFGQRILNNAVLESFTVHTLIFLEFLYSKNP